MKKRVVVTGIGVLSPNGIGKEAFWEGMVYGKSAIRKVTDFDVSQFHSQIAAQIKDFDPFYFGLTKEEVERMDRYVQFAVACVEMAIEDAKMLLHKEEKERIGVCLANAICGTRYMEEEFLRVTNFGKEPIDPRKATNPSSVIYFSNVSRDKARIHPYKFKNFSNNVNRIPREFFKK